MRIRHAFVLVAGLAACSSSGSPRTSGDDGGVVLDGPGSGSGSDAGDDAPVPMIDAGVVAPDGGPLAPPDHGFQIISPAVDIDPGADITYCYYFHTRNTAELAVQKWASFLTDGSHDLIVYLTPTDLQTPGTLSTTRCGFGGGVPKSIWSYVAHDANAEAVMPADDGTGTPVGQIVKAGQSGFLQMHFVNTTAGVLHAHVELNAYAYAADVRVTPAAPFVTYDTRINLDPGAVAPPPTTGTCTVSPTDKFFLVTTHTHKQSVRTLVKDGTTTVFDSASWDHPGAEARSAPPFVSFQSGTLTYECDYKNPSNRQIIAGDNPALDEICMAIGYYFPAASARGHACIDGNFFY